MALKPCYRYTYAKAIGSAQAGNIKEAGSYLRAMQGAKSSDSIGRAAAENGYSAGARQLYGRERMPEVIVNNLLFLVAKNGLIDRLPALISEGGNVNRLQNRFDAQYQFSAGFSPFWDQESAKHFLGNISDDRVIQFFLPLVERQFNATIMDEIDDYIRRIHLMQKKYNLNYSQATCFVQNPESNPDPLKYAMWVSHKGSYRALPSHSSESDKVTLPNEIVYYITYLLLSDFGLTYKEAVELHTLSFKPKP